MMRRRGILSAFLGTIVLLGVLGIGISVAGAAVFNRISVIARPYDAFTTEYTVIARPSVHDAPVGTAQLVLPRDITVVSARHIADASSVDDEGEAEYTVEPHSNGIDDVYTFVLADEEGTSGLFDWQGVQIVLHADEPLYSETDDGQIVSSFRFVAPNPLSGLEIGFEAPARMTGSGAGVVLLEEDAYDRAVYGITRAENVRADEEIVAQVVFNLIEDPGPAEAVALSVTESVEEHNRGLIIGALIGAIILVVVVVVLVARKVSKDRKQAQ
ncbi:MAG: hypothetical protein FWG78_00805 [Coriobacteriia bacterium]|nr:hypothetical protein [Coriobacteriia bacterium]